MKGKISNYQVELRRKLIVEKLVEFYHLRSFVVVAETKNLTKAAKQLYTTPPAVSSHIKALEEELKTTLFIRSSKGMALTEKGEVLLKQAYKTLESAQGLVNLAVESHDQIIGTFRLGFNRDASSLKLVELAKNLNQHCPGIKLELLALTSGQVISLLNQGKIDGGFIYGEAPSSLLCNHLATQAITTIAPCNMDLSQVHIQSDLINFPWISVGADCPFDKALAQFITLPSDAMLISSDNQSRANLVEHGLGLSFIENEIAIEMVKTGKVQSLSLLDTSLPLNFVINKTTVSSPIVRAVLLELCDVWQVDVTLN